MIRFLSLNRIGRTSRPDVIRCQVRRFRQQLDQVEIDQKILSVPRVRVQANLFETAGQVGNRLSILLSHIRALVQ